MTDKQAAQVAAALLAVFQTPNELDSNGEAANVVDGLYRIARSLVQVASAIEDLAGAVKETGGRR